MAHADTMPRLDTSSFVASDGTEMPMRSWLPKGKPKAVIAALHGFADYSAAFAKPATYWAAHGIATFAYDQRGFGGAPHLFQWSGATTMVRDAKQFTAALRRRYPGVPVYLLGESMGGAVTIAATTAHDPAEADGAILVAPAVWEHNFMGAIERAALSIAQHTVPGLWLEPPRGLNIHPSDNIEMLRAMARDSLVQFGARADTTAGLMDLMDDAGASVRDIKLPTLVLFGAHEEVLPKAAVDSFLKHLPATNVRVVYYPEGYHMLLRDLHGDIVWKDVMAWALDRSAKLASGDECAEKAETAAPCKTR
ncbi:MAG TPA: lysophospholipase [Alphaproteobacteria bacterium]|nr:lysophospholipase [Alphaproteobacteria bacterium]